MNKSCLSIAVEIVFSIEWNGGLDPETVFPASSLNKQIGLESKLTLSESTFEPLLVVQPEFWVILRKEVARRGQTPHWDTPCPTHLLFMLINIARD